VHAVNAVNHTFDNYPATWKYRIESVRQSAGVGPGHNIGVALRFVAEGASLVVCLDKFVPFQDTLFHRMLYAAPRRARRRWRLRFDEAIRSSRRHGWRFRLRYVFGRSIDAATDLSAADIRHHVSNAVIEEAHDADAAFRAMDGFWRPAVE
jgi:hypothetical protein